MARPTNDPGHSRKPGSIWEDIRHALGVRTLEDRVVATAVFICAVLLVYGAVDAITKQVDIPDVVALALMVAMGPLAATITIAVLLFLHRRTR